MHMGTSVTNLYCIWIVIYSWWRIEFCDPTNPGTHGQFHDCLLLPGQLINIFYLKIGKYPIYYFYYLNTPFKNRKI